jgi:hypothetical protein
MSNQEMEGMPLEEEIYPDSPNVKITLRASAAAEPLSLSDWPWCLAPDAGNGAAYEGLDTKRYMLDAMGWPSAMHQELDKMDSAKRLPMMALAFAVANNQHSFNMVSIAAIVTMFSTSHARRMDILKEWKLGDLGQPMRGPTHDFGLYRSSLHAADQLSQSLRCPVGLVSQRSEWHDGTFLHSFFKKACKDADSGIRVSTFLDAEELSEFKIYMNTLSTLFRAMQESESNNKKDIKLAGRFKVNKADPELPSVFMPFAKKEPEASKSA